MARKKTETTAPQDPLPPPASEPEDSVAASPETAPQGHAAAEADLSDTGIATTPEAETPPSPDAAPDMPIPPEPEATQDAAPEATPEVEPAQDAAQSPEPAAHPPSPPASTTPPAPKGGAGWAIVGGVVAAALGFGLAQVVPQGWPLQDTTARFQTLGQQIATLEGRLAAQESEPRLSPEALGAMMQRLSALEGTAEALSGAADSVSAINTKIQEVEAQVATIASDRAALDTRIQDIESRLQSGSLADSADLDALRTVIETERARLNEQAEAIRSELQAELAALLQEARAEAAILQDEAAKAQVAGILRGGILMLRAALDSGESLAPGLQALAEAGIDIPPDLAAQADGVATLASLRDAFPDAAREALALARSGLSEEPGAGARFWAFLLRQVGARSLAPRAGDDADAVLSRAEAALRAGDLPATLTELAALDAGVAAPFAEWRARASSRLAAQTALADLARAQGME